MCVSNNEVHFLYLTKNIFTRLYRFLPTILLVSYSNCIKFILYRVTNEKYLTKDVKFAFKEQLKIE